LHVQMSYFDMGQLKDAYKKIKKGDCIGGSRLTWRTSMKKSLYTSQWGVTCINNTSSYILKLDAT